MIRRLLSPATPFMNSPLYESTAVFAMIFVSAELRMIFRCRVPGYFRQKDSDNANLLDQTGFIRLHTPAFCTKPGVWPSTGNVISVNHLLLMICCFDNIT